jgi:hypothetical protein
MLPIIVGRTTTTPPKSSRCCHVFLLAKCFQSLLYLWFKFNYTLFSVYDNSLITERFSIEVVPLNHCLQNRATNKKRVVFIMRAEERISIRNN